MRKQHFIATLLWVATALTACGGDPSSTPTPSSSSNSLNSTTPTTEPSISTATPIIPTENLTNDMFAELKKGYAAEFYHIREFDDASYSMQFYDVRCNEENYAFKLYGESTAKDKTKGNLSQQHHYQTKPGEENKMLYDAGLSVGNDIIYTPVLGEDPFTYQEIELTWEEGNYSNVFLDLSAEYFTRVESENRFRLDIASDLDADTVSSLHAKLGTQLYFEAPTNTSIESFDLLTNGDQIVGYELVYTTYSSYDSNIACKSVGTFVEEGESVIDYEKPLEGQTDPVFEEAITKLKKKNFHLEQSQKSFDIISEKWIDQGSYVADFEDGKSVVYDYFNANKQKTMGYGYTQYFDSETKEEYKLGLVKLGDKFYGDYIYTGTMDGLLPSFNLSSILFKKDEAASTNGQLVYKLDNSITISRANDDSVFTPFDADGYNDLIIYCTITIEEDKINIHNRTSDEENSGLIIDVTYTNFGGIKNLIPSYETEVVGLPWSTLLSNNQSNLDAIIATYTKDILDGIPSLDGYAYVASDISGGAAKPVIFVVTYDEKETNDLITSYGEKLVANGFTADLTSKVDEDSPVTLYYKNVTIKNRTYRLNVSLAVFWNSFQGWGQFQISLYLSKAE